MNLLPYVDKNWTLFLDRDGVINVERDQDYVKNINEFVFAHKAPWAIAQLNRLFGVTVIVTNQRGISRGLMTEQDLILVHEHMQRELELEQAHIDKIYFAPDLHNDAPNRKPNGGMALQAKNDFPSIEFSKSIMVGNTLSDMEFGHRLGMYCVFIQSTKHLEDNHPFVHARYDSLYQFAEDLVRQIDK